MLISEFLRSGETQKQIVVYGILLNTQRGVAWRTAALKDSGQRTLERIVFALRFWVCEESNTIPRVAKRRALRQNRRVMAYLAALVANGFRRGQG